MPEHENAAGERIGAAIRAAAAQVDAPDDLRTRIAEDRRRGAHARRRRLLPAALVAGGALVALVVALAIVLAPGSPGTPSVADAAEVALSAPTRPAPGVDPADPRFVGASIAGIRFPNYAYDSSWRTVGGRIDTLSHRPSQTVVYGLGRVRVGYTIVNGRPLAAPAGARARRCGRHARVGREPRRRARGQLGARRAHLRARVPHRHAAPDAALRRGARRGVAPGPGGAGYRPCDHLTTSVPFMPASSWPGTGQ